jgi:dTDP-4-amino-4,6-dideoxygalactose transaminase
LPVTERITRDSLILPLHHALTDDDQDYIVGILRELA